MKKILITILGLSLLLSSLIFFTACAKKEISINSVIPTGQTVAQSQTKPLVKNIWDIDLYAQSFSPQVIYVNPGQVSLFVTSHLNQSGVFSIQEFEVEEFVDKEKTKVIVFEADQTGNFVYDFTATPYYGSLRVVGVVE